MVDYSVRRPIDFAASIEKAPIVIYLLATRVVGALAPERRIEAADRLAYGLTDTEVSSVE
jgi:hypothetical protein